MAADHPAGERSIMVPSVLALFEIIRSDSLMDKCRRWVMATIALGLPSVMSPPQRSDISDVEKKVADFVTAIVHRQTHVTHVRRDDLVHHGEEIMSALSHEFPGNQRSIELVMSPLMFLFNLPVVSSDPATLYLRILMCLTNLNNPVFVQWTAWHEHVPAPPDDVGAAMVDALVEEALTLDIVTIRTAMDEMTDGGAADAAPP